MAYSIRLPDGTSVDNIPDEVTPEAAKARILQLRPELFGAGKPAKDAGFSLGDIAKSFGMGAAGSTKALTDVAGAENVVSSKLGDVSKSLQESMTPERQAELQRQQERMKAAEKEGTWAEIKAAAQNIAEAPLQSVAQGVGSFVPYLPALFAAPAAAALRLAPGAVRAITAVADVAPKIIGTAQGAGAVKGSIYDGVYEAEKAAGATDDVARQKATAAQDYFGKNFDQIALGTGLGYLAGSTGIEKLLTPSGKAAAQQGVTRRVAGAVASEAPMEGAQGGQERLAQNIALQREGRDVGTFTGVAGQAVQEGLIGALSAGPVAALRGPGAPAPQPKEEEKPAAQTKFPEELPTQAQLIEQQAAELEAQQQRQRAAMERSAANMVGGSGIANQELLDQARIRKEQQERAAAAKEKAEEAERQKALRAERVRIGSTQYSSDPALNEVLRSKAVAEFDAANAPKVEEVAPPEYKPTKTIEQTTPIAQPEGFNVLRGLDSRNADLMAAMSERRAAQQAVEQTTKAEEQKKTEASRADVDQRVAQVENFLMSPAKKTQQETAEYISGVVPEMQKDFMNLLDEDLNQPLTQEQTDALKSKIRERLQPEAAPEEEAAQRTPFKKFLASKGMNTKDVQDIFGENAYRANQQLPGSIKATGPRLDMLAEAAVEEGFLQEEDTDALIQMIKDEFGGDEQVAVGMADERAAAAYEAQREDELASRAAAIGLDTKGMTQDQIAARIDRIERKREEKRRQYSRDIDGFANLPTEEQDRIIDVMIDRFGEPQVFDVERAEQEGKVVSERGLPPEGPAKETLEAKTEKGGWAIDPQEQKVERELKGKSFMQVAQWAVDSAPNAFYRTIAQKVQSRLREYERKGVEFEFTLHTGSTRSSSMRGRAGAVEFTWERQGSPKNSKMELHLNGAASIDNQRGYAPGVQYDTILHELLHAAIRTQTKFLPKTDPLYKELMALDDKVLKAFNAQAKAGTLPPVMMEYYRRENNILATPDELISWGMTDKGVQDWLDTIKVGEKSVLTKLVELMRKVLGLGKPYESAFEKLVRTTDSLLEVDVDTIEGNMRNADFSLAAKQAKKPASKPVQQTLFQEKGAPKAPPTTEAFKRWFGDSKVVDSDGNPLVVYHGTVARPMRGGQMLGDIAAFDRMITTKFRKPSIDTVGSWFSTNPGEGGAGMYAGAGEGSVIYPAYLSIKNPQVTTFQLMTSRARKLHNGKDDGRPIGAEEVEAYRTWLKSMGKDGIKIEGSGNEGSTEFDNQVAWIALEPNQIKSATGNIGTYNPSSTEITSQQRGASTPEQIGKNSLEILKSTGMQLPPAEPGRVERVKAAAKSAAENPAMTIASAKQATSKFLDKMEVAAFSGDAAFNNDVRRNLIADFDENSEVLGMLLEASQSQAVHSDALASQFIIDGGIAYDEEAKKWVSIKKEDNFIALAQKIDKLAEKYGLNKEQAERVAHTYFVAKRFKSLLSKQRSRDSEIDRLEGELEAENANIKKYRKENDYEKVRTSERAKNDIKAEIKKLKEAEVFITPDQIALIEPGMSLAKSMPELTDISDTWQGIRANAVKAMIDGGLWSREQAENMLDNIDYVPFYREEQLEEGGGPQEFVKGLQIKAKEYRLKGSGSPVNDVFDNMVRWSQYAINRSVRNHKALQMVDIGTDLQVGDRKMAEKTDKMDPKKNTIRVFRDGTQEIYSMADPLYVDAFSAISNVTIPSLKFFTWFSNLLRQSVVLYPLFSVAQVPQDAISAMFSSGLKTKYALRIPVLAVKEFIKTLNKTSATHNLLKTYGATGVRDFSAAIARKDVEIAAGLKAQKSLGGRVLEGLSHIAMAADNSVRQAVYDASMAQGLSKAEAIEKAFDIINFRRRGTSKMINLAGQTVPFFYAYMSVQRTAYKTLTGVGISPQKRSEALKTLAATSGAMMAMALFYTMMNADDEEYKKTPEAIRDRTLNIPGTGGLRIPLRPDLFLMPKVMTEHLYHLITDNGLSDSAKFRKSVSDGIANAVLSPQPIPQALKPAIEVGINYDFFQGRPLIGQFEKQKEAERQFNDNTSEFSKVLGQFGVSPIAADHVIRGMFGSAGGLFLYTTNFMINSDPDVPRPELSFRDAMAALPGTSGFVTKASENALKGDFYALRDEVEKTKNTYNDIKTRSPQELEQFLSDEKNIARLGLAKGTEKIGMQLSKIRRAIAQITNAPEDLYSASEKKDAIKELRQVEKEILQSINLPELRKQAMI